MSEILNEIKACLGKFPKYMGLNARNHNAWIARLFEAKEIQGVIGYRRHTRKGKHYGKYRFRYDPYFDAYICPEHKHLYWKAATREGCRQYFRDSEICKACPRRNECFLTAAVQNIKRLIASPLFALKYTKPCILS